MNYTDTQNLSGPAKGQSWEALSEHAIQVRSTRLWSPRYRSSSPVGLPGPTGDPNEKMPLFILFRLKIFPRCLCFPRYRSSALCPVSQARPKARAEKLFLSSRSRFGAQGSDPPGIGAQRSVLFLKPGQRPELRSSFWARDPGSEHKALIPPVSELLSGRPPRPDWWPKQKNAPFYTF